jgi:hypothetical protein
MSRRPRGRPAWPERTSRPGLIVVRFRSFDLRAVSVEEIACRAVSVSPIEPILIGSLDGAVSGAIHGRFVPNYQHC